MGSPGGGTALGVPWVAVLRVVIVTREAMIPLLGAHPVTWLQVGTKAIVVTEAMDGAPNCRAALNHLQ